MLIARHSPDHGLVRLSLRSVFAVSLEGDCIFVKSGRACEGVSTACGVLPRRFISSSVAACIKSNSPSFKCLTALRRFLGRTYRRGSLSVAAFGPGNAEAVAVGNRSGAVRSAGSRPMTLACREQYRSAISVERKWCCRTVLNCRPLLHRAYAFASAAFELLIHVTSRFAAQTDTYWSERDCVSLCITEVIVFIQNE